MVRDDLGGVLRTTADAALMIGRKKRKLAEEQDWLDEEDVEAMKVELQEEFVALKTKIKESSWRGAPALYR